MVLTDRRSWIDFLRAALLALHIERWNCNVRAAAARATVAGVAIHLVANLPDCWSPVLSLCSGKLDGVPIYLCIPDSGPNTDELQLVIMLLDSLVTLHGIWMRVLVRWSRHDGITYYCVYDPLLVAPCLCVGWADIPALAITFLKLSCSPSTDYSLK